jgi:beta-lactam-binding protein with PASTA domain
VRSRRYDPEVVSTSHLSSAEIGRELGGRYRLVAPIGIGTSSRVFLAVDTQLRRRVAVKLLHAALAADDAFLRRFRAEARAAGALSHPNIVAVYDWGEDETDEGVVPYIVTEYLGGGSLRRILDRGRPLSPSQALLIGLDTARALGHAHRRGLIHRDVKPGNLLFDTEGRLRLADFGLARALAEAAWTEPTGTMLGTARYASPEQALGRRLDGRSDVYSLALVLVECVTGQVPFTADTTTGTLALRTRSDVPVPAELGGLRSTVERAGRLDPELRPDADELEISLMAAAESMPRPDPLPLVATLDEAEITAELRLIEDIGGLGPVAVLGDRKEPEASGTDDAPAAGADAAPTTGSDAEGEPVVLERTPIVVAEEHHLLAASRPASFGRVEPFVPACEDDAGERPATVTPRPVDEPKRSRKGLRRLLLALALLAALGGVAAWWFLIRVPVHDVPDLVGRDVGEARALAKEHGWRFDDDTVVRVDDTRPGEIVEQSPRPGAGLAEGETLTVTVSLGPPLVAVPDVVGKPEADARAEIEAAGLVAGPASTRHDESVPAGAVISAGPAPGQEAPAADGTVPKGTELALVVSDGPAPRVVPDGLTGIPVADAKAKLAAVQLAADVQETYDEGVPAGVVISVGTAPGTEVARDSAVPLIVSKGPAPIVVPDVKGMTGTAASAALQRAGFGVSGIEGSPSGVVLATDPPAGETHPRGSPVRIFTRS